jgi:hypothetical protein
MRHLLFPLMIFGLVSGGGVQIASAQQPQRPPITIIYRSTSIVRTQWSGDASSFAGGGAGWGSATSAMASPGLLPAGQNSFTQPSGGGSGPNVAGGGQSLVTNQELQNPSGGFNLTHNGFTQNQYVSPNNYFGTQYQNWNNLRTQSSISTAVDSLNRFQPAMNSGGYYYAPDHFSGAANNQWSNLSNGSVTPNCLGGWTYQR